MKKVSVTYKAPPGESKVAELFGHTFFDGKEESIEVDDRTLEKLKGNKHFKCGEPEDAADAEPDPEQEKAEAEAAEAADKAKRAAQGDAPPSRGAILNKEPPEPEDATEDQDGPQSDPPEAADEGRSFR